MNYYLMVFIHFIHSSNRYDYCCKLASLEAHKCSLGKAGNY